MEEKKENKNLVTIVAGWISVVGITLTVVDFLTGLVGSNHPTVIGNQITNKGGVGNLWLPWNVILPVTGVVLMILFALALWYECKKK